MTSSAREIFILTLGHSFYQEASIGCGFYRCLYLQGCFAPVELSRRHCSLLSDLKDWTHHLDMGSSQYVQATFCQRGFSLFYSPQHPQMTAFMTARLGAVAFTVLWCEGIFHYVKSENIQLTIRGTTLRSQRACHQVLLNALACSVF